MSQPRGQVPVAVVGAGSAGATAANLLGCYGVETLVIDRDRGIVDYPRAIGIDDESVRVLQTAGLAGEIMADAIQNVPLKFFGSSGRCFASVQPSVREFGWYKRNIFLQPLAEAALRRGLGRFPHVQTWFGTEVTGLDQGEDGVTLHLAGRDPVRARYVIAADGGRSGIRHHLGITLDGDTEPRQWVVIDCAADPVDAPWTGLHCDPRRPYVSARLPYGHRRWEFMLHPGEDGAADWITQMRFKPRPRYRDGFFTGPDAGAMFIQPVVENDRRQRMKLDEALGDWFAVVGYGCGPLACVDTAGRALVERLGARVVKIVESRAGDARRSGLCVVEDADNILSGWFAARSRDVAVLRPDRYVAALTTQRELSQALADLGSRPGLARVHPQGPQ